jgi:hypothetical protein
LVTESRMFPELCGRGATISSSNVVLSGVRVNLADGGLAAPALMTDDMLLERECPPRIVDMEPSVSEDMVESGLMYSTLSANPTRTRGTTRGGELSELERARDG